MRRKGLGLQPPKWKVKCVREFEKVCMHIISKVLIISKASFPLRGCIAIILVLLIVENGNSYSI